MSRENMSRENDAMCKLIRNWGDTDTMREVIDELEMLQEEAPNKNFADMTIEELREEHVNRWVTAKPAFGVMDIRRGEKYAAEMTREMLEESLTSLRYVPTERDIVDWINTLFRDACQCPGGKTGLFTWILTVFRHTPNRKLMRAMGVWMDDLVNKVTRNDEATKQLLAVLDAPNEEKAP